jgi:membrane protein
MFWGALFGYWLIVIPLVFPAISSRKWDYLQTLLAPLFCAAGIIVLPYVYRLPSGLEGLMPGLVFMELLIFFPALLLVITSFCTIFKRKIFRIGLPTICFSGLIFLSAFALQTKPHDMEKCFFLIPLVILPIIVLDIFMVVRLFSSMVNGK